MDRKKLLLIVNPAAGRSGYKYNFGPAMKVFDVGGYDTTLRFTAAPGEAIAIAETYAPGFDTVACVGGDGTLSEVMTGLMRLDNPPPLGYIPMGTTNDVATTLDLPKNNTVGAAKVIVNGTAHPFDVGGFGDDMFFAYIAAFGAFTEVSYETPQPQKKRLGHLAYLMQGASQLSKLESYQTRVEYDDGVFEGKLIYGSMSNSTSVAGIMKLPEELVHLGDGLSELLLVKEPESLFGFGELAESVTSGRFDSENLIILHTKKAKFTFDRPVKWTCDGENGGAHQEVSLVNYHAPIKLIF